MPPRRSGTLRRMRALSIAVFCGALASCVDSPEFESGTGEPDAEATAPLEDVSAGEIAEVVAADTSTPPPENKLNNPSFEAWSNQTLPTGWEVTEGTSERIEPGREGGNAARVHTQSYGRIKQTRYFDIAAGSTVQAGCWLRAHAGSASTPVLVLHLFEDNNLRGGSPSAALEGWDASDLDTWREVVLERTAPEGINRAQVAIKVDTEAPGGVDLDDCWLYVLP